MTLEKMKRMAYNWSKGCVCTLREGESQEYHRKVLEMLEREEKYKWHDLRKNPDDLPKEGIYEVIVYDTTCNEKFIAYAYYNSVILCIGNKRGGFGFRPFYDIDFEDHEIIAWREIEPFGLE